MKLAPQRKGCPTVPHRGYGRSNQYSEWPEAVDREGHEQRRPGYLPAHGHLETRHFALGRAPEWPGWLATASARVLARRDHRGTRTVSRSDRVHSPERRGANSCATDRKSTG